MELTALFLPIARELELVERKLEAAMQAEQDNPQINEASCHIFAAGGKRLRPALLLLAARLGDYETERAIRAGVVVEQIHLATLIHDDVVDQAKLRRGKEAINHKWHNKFAVLLGDYLYSSAFLDILADPDPRIVEAVVSATKAMTKGELLQAILCFNPQVTEEEYYQVIEGKTARLISTCCRIGACLAGFDQQTVDNLTQFGYHLGMAFQITDDLLDVISSTDQLGKAAGNDAREGNYSLPLIISLKRATKSDHDYLVGLLSKPLNEKGWAEVARLIENYQGTDYAKEAANDHINQATLCLDKIKKGPTSAILYQIAAYIISREF